MNETNTNTYENINTNIVFTNRIDEIAYNTGVTANANLFLVALIVVLLVCYILWKSLDNFISY